MRRTDFIKARTYTGQKLMGVVHLYHKLDGVRLLYRDGKIVTRNNKEPPGLCALTKAATAKIVKYKDCEVFVDNFLTTSGGLNSKTPSIVLDEENVYPLVIQDSLGNIPTKVEYIADSRLLLEKMVDPTKEYLDIMMELSVKAGYEGLIIRVSKNREDVWYRHKPKKTADVFITGYFEQNDKLGKPKNTLGGFTTNYGNVTAFKDDVRDDIWKNPDQYIGKLMEVEYKELYETGKFRFAVKFLRFRTDKDTESFDTSAGG